MVKRRILNKESVINKAITLVNTSGSPETITLAMLAKALDIRVPSLYNHIDGRDGLLQALQHWGLSALLNQIQYACVGKSGEAALQAAANAYREFALENPGVYPLTLRAPKPDDKLTNQFSQNIIQTMMMLLADFNLDEEQALHQIRAFRSLMHGFISLEIHGGFGLPLDLNLSFQTAVKTYLLGLTHMPVE